jgi:1,4-dihydroxy-2-naphthoate octaprenyltransferase
LDPAVHDGSAPLRCLAAGDPSGYQTAILVVNNYRDIDTTPQRKRTSPSYGQGLTRRLFAGMIYGAYLAIGAFAILALTPRGTAAGVLVLPYARAPVRILERGGDGPDLIQALKLTARAHLWTGVALAVGSAVTI